MCPTLTATRRPETHLLGLAILDNVKGVDAAVAGEVVGGGEEAHVALVDGAKRLELQEVGEVVHL
jgi:hypothetical protein